MEISFVLLISIIALSLCFDYINGFHDAANAIATVVSTKVLSPRIAVLYGAILNFIGALLGTQVATTIGTGLVDMQVVNHPILLVTILSAIAWNLLTWYKGLPSSSSHALMGSLLGATAFAGGFSRLHWESVLHKVVLPMFSSPLIGFLLGYFLMVGLYWACHRIALPLLNTYFRKIQILSCGYMAIMHGANDAQKTMGIIALTIATYYHTPFHVSYWIMVSCAAAIGLGTMAGGWRVIRTIGSKLVKLRPIQGCVAEATGGTVLCLATHWGIPISTTHTITASIMGVGSAQRLSAVNFKIAANIACAWLLTLPATFFFSGFCYCLMHWLFFS